MRAESGPANGISEASLPTMVGILPGPGAGKRPVWPRLTRLERFHGSSARRAAVGFQPPGALVAQRRAGTIARPAANLPCPAGEIAGRLARARAQAWAYGKMNDGARLEISPQVPAPAGGVPPIIFYYRQWQAPMERAALRTPAGSSPGHSALCWDGKLLREIPRLRVKPGARLNPATVKTGYADMAIESWRLFDRLQQEGVIRAGVKFLISLPTPIAPTYNNMVPTDRPALIPVLTTHMLGEVMAIAQALPNDRIALQWDVCQEVIAWEGYYEPGPVIFRQAKKRRRCMGTVSLVRHS